MIEYWKQCCLLLFESNNEAIGYKGLMKEIGLNKAQAVYDKLLSNTAKVCLNLPVAKQVWYGSKPEPIWDKQHFNFYQKKGVNHSEHLDYAFSEAFDQGFRKVIALKADTLNLSLNLLEEAFLSLRFIEFTIGPEENGGFYLLGMNQFEPTILKEKDWKSPLLCKSTIKEIGNLKMALYKTKTLPVISKANDIEIFLPNLKYS